jgi:alpha-glucosidase (family GH31 glycosyl hydrolase)
MMQVASETGMPVMRPVFLAAPNDAAAADIGDEYLYGSELLVAPIVQEGKSQRSVYLPPGKWINYSNRDVYTGSSSVKASASLKEIPVFAKEGAIIPRGDILQANNNWDPEWHAHLSVEFFSSMKVENQFKYFDGHSNKMIRATPQGENLRIEMADLGIPTEALIYLKSFETVEKNGAPLVPDRDFSFDSKTHLLRLSETGAAEITIHGAKDLFNN